MSEVVGGTGPAVTRDSRRRWAEKRYDNMNACVQMLKDFRGGQEKMNQ